MKLGEIKPYPANAKKHPIEQVKKIADSIKAFGFNQPIVLDKDNTIIVGHGRYEAAKLLELEEVPTITVDLTEEQAKAYRLADNKLNESEWDMELAISELKELSAEMQRLTGFDEEFIFGIEKADEINELARERDIDIGEYDVLTVEAPAAPRLKARASFYSRDLAEFNKLKEYFGEKNGVLDVGKLVSLIEK